MFKTVTFSATDDASTAAEQLPEGHVVAVSAVEIVDVPFDPEVSVMLTVPVLLSTSARAVPVTVSAIFFEKVNVFPAPLLLDNVIAPSIVPAETVIGELLSKLMPPPVLPVTLSARPLVCVIGVPVTLQVSVPPATLIMSPLLVPVIVSLDTVIVPL